MSDNPMAGAMRLMSEIRNSHYTKKQNGGAMKPGEYKNEVFNTDDDDDAIEHSKTEKTEKVEKPGNPARAMAKRNAKVNKPAEVKKPAVKKVRKDVSKRVRRVRKSAKRSATGQSAYSITIVGAVKLPGYALDEGEKLAIVRLTPIKGDVRC